MKDRLHCPKVTVTIPTFNSARWIAKCLDSVCLQNYSNIETIVMDGGSSDQTTDIASGFRNVNVYVSKESLLSARILGVEKASGTYILLLDSDQILTPRAIERCVENMADCRMLCLGESVFNPRTFTQKLLGASKTVSQLNLNRYLNPFSGLLIPRFFEASLLKQAIRSIPSGIISRVFDRDHQILFLESWKIDKRVEFVDDAIFHQQVGMVVVGRGHHVRILNQSPHKLIPSLEFPC